MASDEFRDTFSFESRLGEAEPPVYFTGEMVYSWMFQGDYPMLTRFREAAEILAARDEWSPLYDTDRLRDTEVSCAAIVYYSDL